MIDVTIKGSNIVVVLDRNHRHYNKARIITRSLLTAQEFDDDRFYISYDDLGFLRNKLDMSGLVHDRTISEEALKYIDQVYSTQVRNEDIKKGIHNEHVRKLIDGKLKKTIYEDQLSAISYVVNNERSGVFDVMGYGKTVECLAATVALGPAVFKTLVICPLTVIMGFKREIPKHTYLKFVAVPPGRKEASKFIKDNVNGDWNIMLVHPENLIIASDKKSSYMGETTKLLKSMTWDQIVIDEFHMYKNWDAKRTRCVVSIINESKNRNGKNPRVVLMTGTPVSESPTSAYVVLKILNGDMMPHITKFEDYFCVKQDITYGSNKKNYDKPDNSKTYKKLVGYKNLNELKSMIERVSIRRTKDDVVGFPKQTFIIRDVILNSKQLNLYKALCGEIVRELPNDSLINIHNFLKNNTKALKLRQLMNHPELINEEGDSAKYKELDYVFEELLSDPEQKVLVWTEWRKAVDLLYDRYNKTYGAAKLYGGVNNEELDLMRDRFENDDKLRVIISIPAKGGTGLDFLARARTAIYIDRPRSYILYNQSLDRICRRTALDGNLSELDKIRSKPATLMFLDVVNSLDEMIREELWNKLNFVDSVTIKDEKLIQLGKQDLLRYLR